MIPELLLCGAVFSLVWAVAIFAARPEYRERITLTAILLLAGLWQAMGFLHFGGTLADSPGPLPALFARWTPVLLYLLGPFLYRYYRDALLEQPLATSRFSMHLAPAGLAAMLLLIEPGIFPVVLERFPLGLAPKLSVLIYLSFLAFQLVRVVSGGPAPGTRGIVLLLLGTIYASLALGLAGFLTGRGELREWSAASLPLIVFAFFIASQARPGVLRQLGAQVRRYKKSRLRHLDTAEIGARLERLMRGERAYADEDLSLGSLAEELGLTPHQTSEFLNAELGRTFSDFVNEYRIEAAARLLKDEPERSTLSIAHAVGFNSRSAFYRAFRKRTGTDPTRYRTDSSRSSADETGPGL